MSGEEIIHVAGTPVTFGSITRQRCCWCGALIQERDLARISRPGCRVYIGHDEIKRVQGGLGISIMTTPKGVMTGRQARREGVGGELLCEVW